MENDLLHTRFARIEVVGAGAMGAQIAMVCALAGHQVWLVDSSTDALAAAEDQLRTRTDAMVAKQRRSADEIASAYSRIRWGTDLVAEVDLVIEAVVERLEVKRSVFVELQAICPDTTVLTSNSSSFVPSALAAGLRAPQRFLNLHFFNPALVMTGVEVISGPQTSAQIRDQVVQFVVSLGKVPIVVDREIPGFIANRLLGAIRDEALRLLEGGYGAVDAIDTAARTALGHPMGPFELMDLTGIDIGYLTKLGRFEETGDPADLPSSTVAAMVERGHLGRKSGRGFYNYDAQGARTGPAELP